MWYVIYIDKVVSKYKQSRNIKIQEKLTTRIKGGKLKSSRKWKRIFFFKKKDLGFQDEESTRERKGGWK